MSANSAPESTALKRLIGRATGARSVTLDRRVQTLWSGYGEIWRVTLFGAAVETAVVKYVVPPAMASRNSAEGRSHRRKLRSYEVERAFYEGYSSRCGAGCRVPAPVHLSQEAGRSLFVLEDLDAAGFGARANRATSARIRECLAWLANFHATFLGVSPDSLWKVGTYWHLATRPDELARLGSELRRAAALIDERLNRARFKTIVHGDAKLQNFCFAADDSNASAVDFQYAGGGAGIKDVAYFLTSCLSSEALHAEAERHVDSYFRALLSSLRQRESAAPTLDLVALETEWRALYPLACADFYRFLLGWAPQEARHESYLERTTQRVLSQL